MESPSPLQPIPGPPRSSPPRILVVEDNPVAAKSLLSRLESLGYHVVLARSGEQAVALADQTDFQLVLMDIDLGPGMDGVEAARIISGRRAVPVVYVTGSVGRDVADRAKVTEPYGYVLKPFDDRELHVIIEIALHHHRMEQQLARQQRLLTATLGGIADGVVATDREGRVTFLNPAAERLLGHAAGDTAAGRLLHDLAAVNGAADMDSVMKRAAVTDAARPFETTWRRKDGSRVELHVTVSAVRDEDGRATGFVGIVRDVSHVHRLEEQFRQSQKMEAIGRLAGGVAHDFNNLLVVVTGYSNLLLEEMPPGDPKREAVIEIRDAGTRAANLTRQLLAFSRRQAIEPAVLNLNDVIVHIEKMLRRLIGEDVALTAALDPAAHRIKADPGHLEQAVMNLAVNARDAMPRGGRITISTANVELRKDETVGRPGLEPGWYVRLSVADTGAGMSDLVKARLFEPFFTTKEPGKGTGLGLAVVHGFVAQSGGHIEVVTAAGAGTTFHILLPAAKEKVSESSLGGSEMFPAAKRSETVLVVEDEDEVRRITRITLQTRGYNVLEARGGAEAVAAAAGHAGPIHLLVTDVVMPEMGGRQLAEDLRSRWPGLKVLYMSGYLDDAVIRQGIGKGSDVLLRKPFTPSVLAKKVRAVLDN